MRLKLGEAFDVTADKVQTDFVKLSGMGPWQYQFETAYRFKLRNAKPEAVKVRSGSPSPATGRCWRPVTLTGRSPRTWRNGRSRFQQRERQSSATVCGYDSEAQSSGRR